MSADALVEELARRALDLPSAERAAFLARQCAGEPELRRRVEERLLASAAPPSDPTLLTPAMPAREPALREGPGSRIGPYKLLQQIGEGGFGVVFMADQVEPVRRRVALKVIKLGMDTRRVVARFEAERQALALMEHPHIARVLDAGATDSGRPYFVMELVKGEPITTYADREKLSIRERLELFLQVCQAVQHAHHKGVIHRDLKPSNVLVATQDGRPHAKVIDFGIAKATDQQLTDKTLFTELNALIGTPAYMSPEQAQGSLDIDTRTDVYSLGVLLYELLAGSPPFDPALLCTAAQHEVLRIIREVDPPRPSARIGASSTAERAAAAPDASPTTRTLDQLAQLRRTEPARLGTLVRGELDWLVMSALEKDRARRYGAASELGADLERHLAGEPVRAAPPSAAYRLRKLVRRHRGRALAGAAILVSLLASTALATQAWRRASVERDRAEDAKREAESERSVALAERARADQERDAAVAAQGLAEAARVAAERARESADLQRRRAELQERAGRQLTDFFTRLFSLGDLRSELTPDASLRELLAFASTRLSSELSDNPLAEARLAATLGEAFLWLGPDTAAEELLRRSLEIQQRTGTASEEERIDLLLSYYWAGASASTERFYIASLEAWKLIATVLGRHDLELGEVLERFEAVMEEERGAAHGYPRTVETARWIVERTARRLPAGHPHRRLVADFLSLSADWILWFDEGPAASRLLEEALAIYVAELGWEDQRSLRCQMSLAGSLTATGDFERAEAFLRPRLLALRPKLGDEHELVELFEFRLGECRAWRGETGALEDLRQLLARAEQRYGRRSTTWRRNCGRLARALERAGDTASAELLRLELADVAVDIPRDPRFQVATLEGRETGALLRALERIGDRHRAELIGTSEANEAVLELLRALAESVRAELEPEDPRRVLVSRTLTQLADEWEERWGSSATVSKLAEEALHLLEPFEERAPFDVSRALTTLLRSRELRPGGDLELAQRIAEEAVELRLRARVGEWAAGSAESMLGEVLIRRGRYQEARRTLARGYVRMLRELGAEDPNTRIALARLVRACRGEGSDSPASHAWVQALGRLLFATVLGAELDAREAELEPLWRELEAQRDEAAGVRALLAALRGRPELEATSLELLAGLAQVWAVRYLEEDGALEAALAVLLELRDRASARSGAGGLELELALRAAELCETSGALARGAEIAQLGLDRAAALGLESGARAAKLASFLGHFLAEEGRLAEAGPWLASSYESLRVLEGSFGMSTVIALRRLVAWHAARGELESGALLAADLLGEILLRSDAAAWLLDELAYYVVVAPGLERRLYERAASASSLAVEKSPRESRFLAARALGHLRLDQLEATRSVLGSPDAISELEGPLRARHLGMLALVHAHQRELEPARRALQEADVIAATDSRVTHTTRLLLEEARRARAAH